ncbi:MAG TPA: efflux RND transporter periplasmic adaptor subunit [Deltaproteobacteria bacterium]|nr:efflux RND transporter periplasmic adaptor subunit [Deltaproteobacteria bacterium]
MNKKYLIAIAAAILIAGAALFIFGRNGRNSSQLKLSGTLEITSVELSFKVPGRLTRRLADEGEQVKNGQVVARLDDRELRDERNARLAEQQAARAALADIRAGSRREEINQGIAALQRMQADAEKLERDARRMEALFKSEVIARRDLDAARAARDASAAAVREAEEHLRLLETGPRPDAVKERQARAEAAAAMLSYADERLSQAVLTSPLSGVVLAKHAEAGEILAAGSPVITIGKMDEIWVRGYVPENELGRIKPGQNAKVTVDTWPGRVFEGRVSFIAQQAEFTPKNVQTEKERVKLVYRIKITIPNPDMALKPGMPADAVIMTDSK